MQPSVIITEEQLALRPSQRAMIAATLANVPRGSQVTKMEQGAISNSMAAKMLHVHPNTVVFAKMLLRYGTPEVIKAVQIGRIGLRNAVKDLPQPPGPDDNARHAGKNPARIERMKQNALVWKALRGAMLHLATLPRAADVLVIAKRMDRHNNILPKVPAALAWLKEFADVISDGEAARAPSKPARDAGAAGTEADPGPEAV